MMNRADFLKMCGLGALTALVAKKVPEPIEAPVATAGYMQTFPQQPFVGTITTSTSASVYTCELWYMVL